ncbi:hypothetical protein [Deinococcus altitudinis]|uniref:hypothetical protein n=1 Tax=Deinococcus altitudinis TaxID=468914 RepID=UPI003891D38F
MLNFLRREPRPNPYRGAVLGLLGGVVGTLAMGQYWVRVSPLLTPDSGSSDDSGGEEEQPKPDQNVISPFGQQHEPGESSTAALGRHLYSAVTGKTPGKQTSAALSEGVHWGTGILSGALFGALTARHSRWPAGPLTGAAFGALLWVGNDEGLVPLLGLQDGPAASPVSGHLNRLGAHVFYGAALGLGLWALDRVMPETD